MIKAHFITAISFRTIGCSNSSASVHFEEKTTAQDRPNKYLKHGQRRFIMELSTLSGGRTYERARIMIDFSCEIPY